MNLGRRRFGLTALVLGPLLSSAVAQSQPAPAGAPASAATFAEPATSAPAHGVPKLSKGAAPPPPPTPQQLKAFELLRQEAKDYEKDAREYRRTLTMIVRQHYEMRRKRILNALDKELTTEKQSLVGARNEAIARLEDFVNRYSGANADQRATPDAMFRLAALYEERARESSEGDVGVALEPAIALYRRLIKEFPQYEEVAAVHYYLGHSLTDAARLEEGQQAWRALVCSNRYKVKDDARDARKLALEPLAQDHDSKFWNEWGLAHPVPLDQQVARPKVPPRPAKPSKPAKRPKGTKASEPATLTGDEEIAFVDPYAGCEPIAQNTAAGEEPRYLAEVWWQLGNYHFDQIDLQGGPYNFNRAVSAYDHSMQYKKPPIFGVSMYKQAWTYYKQQRYKPAVLAFVELLRYADEQEAKTGDPGADFRSEAYTYMAGSLTYVDFDGPPAEHPYIPRNDVLDTELDPLVAEQKMSIALQRVQDPALIPQDQKWTVEIYKALAQEFIELTQNRNAVAALELTLSKFPMNRDAPVMQNRVSELYDQLSRLAPEGSAARAEYGAKGLEARTRLAAYVGTTPWVDANRDDPEALQSAEALVRGGLKRAAADHTNFARAYYERALERNDPGEQRGLIEKAIAEYRFAETGWNAYLEQDPQALDAYETRFWMADARYWIVVLEVAIERSPTREEVVGAREAAAAVRDSNEDDKYLQPAAYYVVTVSEKALEDEYRLHEKSGGKKGIEKRDELEFEGDGEKRKPVRAEVPALVQEAIRARDEYNERVALDRDPQKNGLLYSFQSADLYFVYGNFDLARARFRPLYDQYCGVNEWGYKAWEKLISMSNFEGNADESRRLVEGKSCAYNAETARAEEAIRKPVKQGVAYLDARKLYEEAEKLADGAERSKKWREAAAAYKVALDAAPDRDEAPEAAMNGAYAYKQVGEYDKAIEMYELFIARYGSNEKLEKLSKGDPTQSPPAPPDPKRFEERVKYLKSAYDALAGAYVLFFNYPRAAETFDKISDNYYFGQNERREAARQGLTLYASLGDRGGMQRTRERVLKQGASPQELAEADFIVASSELKKWDPLSPDEGANANARMAAARVMEDYYNAYKGHSGAEQYVVQASYWVMRAHKLAMAGDTFKWLQATILAFERWKKVAPQDGGRNTALGSREAGMAAEAEYMILDEAIANKFDYETGHHRYAGTTVEVVKQYTQEALKAQEWYDKLQHVIDAYLSPEWTVAALSRQGSLYDSLRTGLYNARPPALRMFNAKQEAALKRAEESDNADLQEQADQIRVTVQTAWRTKRDQELDSADAIMIDRYANSVVGGRRYNVSGAPVVRAIRRLAFVTELIGEAKMKQFIMPVKELSYTDGMFLRMRPGQSSVPAPNALPEPLPVSGGGP